MIKIITLCLLLSCASSNKVYYFYVKTDQPLADSKYIIEQKMGYEIIKIDTVIRIQYTVPDSLK